MPKLANNKTLKKTPTINTIDISTRRKIQQAKSHTPRSNLTAEQEDTSPWKPEGGRWAAYGRKLHRPGVATS